MTIFCTTTVGSIIQTFRHHLSISARAYYRGGLRTFSVCAPGCTGNTIGTSMMLFATHPFTPSHASGRFPGVAGGTKWLVWGAPSSI